MEPIRLPLFSQNALFNTPIATPRDEDSQDAESTSTETSDTMGWSEAIADNVIKDVAEKKIQSSDFLIKLGTVLSERHEEKLKRRGGFQLVMGDDGYLFWKPLVERMVPNPLTSVHNRSQNKQFLIFALAKFQERIKDRDAPDGKEFVNLFDKLMEMPCFRECLKKQGELRKNWIFFINDLLFGNLSVNAEALKQFLLSTKYDIPILVTYLKNFQKNILRQNKKASVHEVIALLGHESLVAGLSESEKNNYLQKLKANPEAVMLPTPRISTISYDELFHMCIHAIMPFVLKQREIENDLESYIKKLTVQKANLIFLHEQNPAKIMELKRKALEAFDRMELGLCLGMLQQEYVLAITNCMEYVESTLRYIVDKTSEHLLRTGKITEEQAKELQSSTKAALKVEEGAPTRDLRLRLDVVKVNIRELVRTVAEITSLEK